MNTWYKVILPALAATMCLTACGHTKSTNGAGDSKKIKIVAAENFYGEVARAVGGNHVQVTSVIKGSKTDPHDFQPTPETAKQISGAQVVIYNGIGYDNWMNQLLSSTSNGGKKTVIRVGNDVAGKKNGDNEHVWYSPQTMPRLASTLANDLAKMDPKHAEDYRKHAATYKKLLKPFLDQVDQLKQSGPKKVEVTEPVFNYMLAALNDKLINKNFPLAIEKGTDPAPADFAQMEKALKHHKVAFLVENIQAESPTVNQLVRFAKENHVPIVRVTETMPKGETYRAWMMGELQQIKKITKQGARK